MNTTVLIVEDDVVPDARALEQDLKGGGYEVIGIAETIKQAVEMSSRHRPSVIIMDIELSNDKRAGFKAAEQIRSEIDTQIIYLTKLDIEDDLLRTAAETKPFGFLTKPWTKSQLLATVRLAALRKSGKSERNLVFICYSHEDSKMMEELARFLQPLARAGIDTWVDTKIGRGLRWKEEISKSLRIARAAVLLVSIDFVNSRFITEVELPQLLKAELERGLRIVPVFVGHVPSSVLTSQGLAEFQGVNPPHDPVGHWHRDRREREAWMLLYNTLESTLGQQ